MSARYLYVHPEAYDLLIEQADPHAFRRYLAERAVDDAAKQWWITWCAADPSNNTAENPSNMP